jgi:c-di-GMP-binding flagellar brake protein YcgR
MGEIREGQKVKFEFKTVYDEDKEIDCFISGIYSDRLALTIPEEISEYSEYFEEGSEIAVKIYTPLGVKAFDTIILDSPLSSDFIIEYSENVSQIQRREYTRVELSAKIIVERTGHQNVVTNTIDISGGGLRIKYDGTFEPKEKVGALLYLPFSIRSIKAKAIVIQGSHLPKNEHILLFTEIDEHDRDKIIKACFDIQIAKYKPVDESE